MAARIRSTISAGDIDEASRDDAVVGSIVTVVSLDAATTYAWAITFAPEGSTAALTGSASAISPGTFTVDKDGAYLIRLITDATLGTEDVQYVRVRALTAFGSLTLVAAGERRDGTGTIPVDIDTEGWANEQNFNIQTLLAFIKPLVSSGRVLYADPNDGTAEYADHDTIQAAIDDAVTNTPSDSEQWVVLARPGRFVEDVTFADFVHVIGWPGNPDGVSSEAVVIEGTHSSNPSSGATTLLANLHIENNSDTTTPTLSKGGDGALRLYGTRVESNGTDAAQGAAVNVTTGTFDAINSYFLQNVTNGALTVPFRQSAASTALLDTCILVGPSGSLLNDLGTPVVGIFTTMTNCRVVAAHADGTAIVTTAEQLTVDRCALNAGSDNSIAVNANGATFAGDVAVTVRFSDMGGKDIKFETSGLSGSTELNLGSVIYRDLVYPSATPTEVALTKSFTHFYDNTLSVLVADNVQDALDELAAVPAILPAIYHKNIPEVANDTVRYRGWAAFAGELIAVRAYMESVNTVGAYTLTVTNEATGNTALSAATFDMNTLVDATVGPVGLTAVPADLLFGALDRWTIELTSDDPGFDGSAIYIELVFNMATVAGPVVEDLATTLLVNNITGGTDIELTTGDEIVGQTGVVLRATGAASDIEMFPGASGAVIVNGKLTVTGIIDPTAMVFTQNSGVDAATAAGEGGIFVSNGASLLQADTPYFVPENSAGLIPLLGGTASIPTFVGIGGTPALGRDIALYSPSITSATVAATLPPASTMRGRVITIEHRGNGTGTLTIDGDTTDTIGGSAAARTVLFEEILRLESDGVSDWRIVGRGTGILEVSTTITPAQIRALDATPITIIPAPGAGRMVIPLSFVLFLDFGSVVHVDGGDLGFRYSTEANNISLIEGNTFINAANDEIRQTGVGRNPGAPVTIGSAANDAIEIFNDGAAYAGAGDSPMVVKAYFLDVASPL